LQIKPNLEFGCSKQRVFIVYLKYLLPLLAGPLPVWLNKIIKIKEKEEKKEKSVSHQSLMTD